MLEIASSKFAASAIAARIGAVRRQGDVSVSMALIPSADPAEKSSGIWSDFFQQVQPAP